MKQITQTQLTLFVSLFLVLFYNYTFFTNLVTTYPLNGENFGFILSIALLLVAFFSFLFALVGSKYTLKPIMILVFMISSFTSYFMNNYGVIIDDSMIRNMMQTNIHESLDLLTFKQVLYVTFLGALPSFIVYKIKLQERGVKKELFSKLKLILLALLVIGSSIYIFSKHYTSFFREHKPLRYTVNPGYWIYSTGKYINLTFESGELVVEPIGLDAKVVKSEDDNRSKLVIMVVGEAARADRFSLNGYKRETNPLLAQEDIINFSNVSSCGTSTAESVPCMFAIYDRSDYSYKKGIRTQNALDVLDHTGRVAILWRDNNSDSKGVALRVPYESYSSSKTNTICTEGECRDIGMLEDLDTFLVKNSGKDILIVLHQMGNHGPAYYKRYTKEFEKFTPVCKTNQIEKCTQEEVSNAYDNAILYTDFFLHKTIEFLKTHDKEYRTAMLYMSDHGESLGEKGVYLHGLPYFMAPEAQTHIGAIVWLGEGMKELFSTEKLLEKSQNEYSQDNLFHTLLGIFEVETQVYKKDMDIFK